MPTATEFFAQHQQRSESPEKSYSVPAFGCWVCRDSGVVRRLDKFIHDPQKLNLISGFSVACGCQMASEGQLVIDEINHQSCRVISDELRQQELEAAQRKARGEKNPELEAAVKRAIELAEKIGMGKTAPAKPTQAELLAVEQEMASNSPSDVAMDAGGDSYDIPF